MKEVEKLEMLKRQSDLIFGDYGKYLYDEWDKYNQRIFQGQLKIGVIQCGLTPHGKTLGYYHKMFNTITIHWSLVANEGRFFSQKKEKKNPLT